MKKLTFGLRALGLALASLVMAVMLVAPAFAATQYRVRVYAGKEGKVNGSTDYDEVMVDYGGTVRLSDSFAVEVTDASKYYFKGFRLSGKDNRDGLYDQITSVTEDMDFVVAYGSRGKMTTYTVRFVENGTGNALQDDQGRSEVTYEGKVGDKPVVAYSYVPGYRPLYNNITGTLKEKASDNVWDLPYVRVETETVIVDEGTTTTTVEGTTTTTTVNTPTTTTTTTPTTTTTTTPTATEEGTGTETTTTPTPTTTVETTPTNPPTEEILDVDNPLAGPGQNDDGKEEGTGDEGDGGDESEVIGTDENPTTTTKPAGINPFLAIVAAAGVAALGGLLYFFYKRRQEEEGEE